jgi:hypothetical protein
MATKTWIGILLAIALVGCATRFSNKPDDWVGPRHRNFELDYRECQDRMEQAGMRILADSRQAFLDCMEKRGWSMKERS